MIRLAELLLLFAPLAGAVAWRVWAPGKAPSYGAIAGLALALLVLAAGLVFFRFRDAAPPGTVYVPRHIENGIVIPERTVP